MEQNTSGDGMHTPAAARFLGVKETTLETWRSRGRGPVFYRPGGKRVIYRREDLEVFLAAWAVKPGSARLAAKRSHYEN